MKNVLLLSIKPQYATKIFDGSKTVELRRIKPKHLEDGDLILVYESAPVKALVGAFEVEKVIEDSIDKLWKKVENKSAISKSEYDAYFKGTSTGVGIFISQVWKLHQSISLENLKQEPYLFTPPQSFRYATDSELVFASQLQYYQKELNIN
jgi:predicted transcriptional regulator